MTTTRNEIDDYVAAVRTALADLPADDREELLDDLPQHLADVRADHSGTLTELLGPPKDYAAELRTTAGLAAGRPAAARRAPARIAGQVVRLTTQPRVVDLVRSFAPTWWLVRAWLVVEIVTGAGRRSGTDALIPVVGDSRTAGVLLMVLACAGSVWLGRRARPRGWQRPTLVVAGLALAVWGGVVLRDASRNAEPVSVVTVEPASGSGFGAVTNIYPVGPDGKVLRNVRLYDQDGTPISLGGRCPDGTAPVAAPASSGPVRVGFGGDGVTIVPNAPSDGSASSFALDGSGYSFHANSADVYPLSCPVTAGPFPSGTAPALPSSVTGSSPSPSPSPAR